MSCFCFLKKYQDFSYTVCLDLTALKKVNNLAVYFNSW